MLYTCAMSCGHCELKISCLTPGNSCISTSVTFLIIHNLINYNLFILAKSMSSLLNMLHKVVPGSVYMTPLSILPLFLFLIFLYKWLYTNSTRNQNVPPSPPKLPVLGHLHKLGVHPHRSLQALSKRYGDLMLIYLGNRPTLIVSSASLAKEIMRTHDAVASNRPKFIINDRLLYDSTVVGAAPYGEYWRQMKSIYVLQLLSSRRVRSYRLIREEETAALMKKIQKSKAAVNLSEIFTTFTNDVTCRVAFGRKYGGDQEKGGIDFQEFLDRLMELLGAFNIGDYIPWLAWVNRFNGFDKRMDDIAKKFDMLLEDILNEHIQQSDTHRSRSESENEIKTKDFVDVLLEVQREHAAGLPLEREAIKALILEAFSAGTHTTATVLEWAMTELLRHPRVMKQLQKEVRGTTGLSEGIAEDDLKKMSYLKAVIKETMRLHPPIPLLVPRESTKQLKLKGYDVAAGTLVFVSAWAIHRDPEIWEEPEEFRPERFLNSSVDFKGQDFELIPFGAGRRVCPGLLFAIANNELLLANLVHKFDWLLPAGATGETLDMSEGTGLTVRRKNPLLAIATPYLC